MLPTSGSLPHCTLSAAALFFSVVLFVFPASHVHAASNVALGKPVMVTTNGANDPGPGCGRSPADITDGRLNYKPASSNEEDGVVCYVNNDYNQQMTVTVTIDLGKLYNISSIRYHMGDVQFGDTWKSDRMISPFGTTTTVPGGSFKGAWTTQTGQITASSVSITFTKTRRAWNEDLLFIGEIEIYGTATPPFNIKGFGIPPVDVRPQTDEEVREMMRWHAEIAASFTKDVKKLRRTLSPNDALQQAVNNLSNNPTVTAVVYDYKTLDIYTKYENPLIVHLDAEYRTYRTASSKRAVTQNTDFLDLESQSVAEDLPSDETTFSTSQKRKALIFSPYQSDFKDRLCPIKRALENSGFSVDYVVDDDQGDCGEITVFDEKIITKYIDNLHTYDVIYINTHATPKSLVLGIETSDKNDALVSFMKRKGTSTAAVSLIDLTPLSENSISITDKYIRNYFTGEKRLKASLVVIDGCQSAAQPERLPEAFISSGAKIYIGYDESITPKQAREFTVPFFNEITRSGTSLSDAFSTSTIYWPSWLTCPLDTDKPVWSLFSDCPGINVRVLPEDSWEYVLIAGAFSGKWYFHGKGTYRFCDVYRPGKSRNYQFVTDMHMTLKQTGSNIQGTQRTSRELIGICQPKENIVESVTGKVLEDNSVELTFVVTDDAPGCRRTGSDGCSVWIGDEPKGGSLIHTFEITRDGNLRPKETLCVAQKTEGCLIKLDSYFQQK